MQEPQNITDFKQMAGRILGTLYDTHPSEMFIEADAFFDADLTREEEDLFDDTLAYLCENGYLTRTSNSTHVRLNDRAYHILQKPNPLEPKESIGYSLAKWTKGSISEASRSAVATVAGSALTLLYSILKGSGG